MKKMKKIQIPPPQYQTGAALPWIPLRQLEHTRLNVAAARDSSTSRRMPLRGVCTTSPSPARSVATPTRQACARSPCHRRPESRTRRSNTTCSGMHTLSQKSKSQHLAHRSFAPTACRHRAPACRRCTRSSVGGSSWHQPAQVFGSTLAKRAETRETRVL